MRTCLAVLAPLALSGCCLFRTTVCPTCPPTTEACLAAAPAAELPVPILGPEQGCPPEFPVCLDVDGALALEANVQAMRRYSREAWTRCGPTRALGASEGQDPSTESGAPK